MSTVYESLHKTIQSKPSKRFKGKCLKKNTGQKTSQLYNLWVFSYLTFKTELVLHWLNFYVIFILLFEMTNVLNCIQSCKNLSKSDLECGPKSHLFITNNYKRLVKNISRFINSIPKCGIRPNFVMGICKKKIF